MAPERVVTGVPGPGAGTATVVDGDLASNGEDSRNRGQRVMGKAQMTADEVLKKLGKPSGPSVVTGEDDPIVTWPYPQGDVSFRYRDRAWRVWR